MIKYICTDDVCGYTVIAHSLPYPMHWTDGHTCYFKMEPETPDNKYTAMKPAQMLKHIQSVINDAGYYMSWTKTTDVHVCLPYRDLTLAEVIGAFTKDAQKVLAFYPMIKAAEGFKGVWIKILK